MSKYHKILTESRRFVKKDVKRKQDHDKAWNKRMCKLMER